MFYNPDKGFPRVVPELRYEDAGAALEWLCRVFGCRELLRWEDENGAVGHADFEFPGGGICMLERGRGAYQRPGPGIPPHWIILVFVDDVDEHYRRVVAAGGQPEAEPADRPWGLRQYRVPDLEGHVWEFSQHLRDVPADQWGAIATAGE